MSQDKKPTMVRQGDALVREIDEIPSDAEPVPDQEAGRVLIKNPRTGHAHVLTGGAIYRTRGPDPRTIIEIAQPAQLVHDEHATLEIPPGIFELVKQRTYQPSEIQSRSSGSASGWTSRDVDD